MFTYSDHICSAGKAAVVIVKIEAKESHYTQENIATYVTSHEEMVEPIMRY